MIRTITFIIVSTLLLSSFNKTRHNKTAFTNPDCESNWNYFSLTDTVKGSVLFHAKAPFGCGVLASASLSIIKTSNDDTMRVLWLCNLDIDFKKSTTVTILPGKKPNFGVVLPFKKSEYDCVIKNTCYGSIAKAK